MYNTKLPPMSARPSLAYSGRLVYPAWTFTSLPSFNGWVHLSGRIVLHRGTGNAREVVVAVVVGGKAWRVDSGKPAQARDLARRIELAVADIPQDLWSELDSCDTGYHPSSQRWPEFVAAFDRHDARNIKES
jgi:hypothetical protein